MGNRTDSSQYGFLGARTVNKHSQQQADTGPQLQPAEERRRSQRVMIRIPVTLEVTIAGKKTTLSASTASVNDHGAMLLCTRNFSVETKFDLINDRTMQKQSCRVTRAALENPQGYLIPVEFAAPAPGFWHISFPPPGWKGLEN
jgi:hypothetical protein